MDELAKLRWQCRRGTKELDLLLCHYLENHYPLANPEGQQRFVELLALDDAALMQEMLVILENVKLLTNKG